MNGKRLVSTLSPTAIIEAYTKKNKAIKFVEWNFIVPEDYHSEKEVTAYPKPFKELYTPGTGGNKVWFWNRKDDGTIRDSLSSRFF